MKTPRWITVVVGLVVVNGAFVTATVLHKHVWAQAGDDFAATESQPNDDTELPVLQAEGNSVGTTKTESESHYSGLTERAEPQLPEVPSLSDSELLESDPVFSEIKKMFSDSKFGLEGNSELAAPPSAPVEPSADYFRKLDSRLQTAMRLCRMTAQCKSL